jgi:sulfur-carrier protein
MATVHIPAPMRTLTGGQVEVQALGATLGEVIESLEAAYPGLKERLTEGSRLRPALAVFVDGEMVPAFLTTKVGVEAEIYIAPAISGG